MSDKEKPIIKFKDHPYEIALWRKENEHGTFYDGSLTYSYKDQAGSYQNIKLPMDGAHLGRVIALLQAASFERLGHRTVDREQA